jgi:hypothetical protein
VTAYGLRAAAIGRNVAVADAAYTSLMRGAALNLSNMENLEWLSGQPLLADPKHPELLGPVISSRRQLWSVGAYLGMVVRDVFGVATTRDGISLAPFVTARLRAGVFADSAGIALNGLHLQGRTVNVRLRLPPVAEAGAEGYYAVERIRMNGKPAGAAIPWSALKADNDIEIVLGRLVPGDQALHRVNADPYQEAPAVFGPREPRIGNLVRSGADTTLTIAPADGQSGITYNVYRDGKQVASALPAGAWTDRGGAATACYAVEAQYTASGNRSHHSMPRCVDAGVAISMGDQRVETNVPMVPPNPRFAEAHADWGRPGDRFAVRDVRVPQAGTYALQVRYHNSANEVNLGISGGVKWLAVKDAAGVIVAEGVVQLPHARLAKGMFTTPVFSTPLALRLNAGSAYRIEMSDFYNMSYLQSNSSFSAAGGVNGPSNRVDLFGVRLLRTE